MSRAATNSNPPGTYARSRPPAKSTIVRPMRDGLKSLGPMMAQEMATTTSSPSAPAFRHSCSTSILDQEYGRTAPKG